MPRAGTHHYAGSVITGATRRSSVARDRLDRAARLVSAHAMRSKLGDAAITILIVTNGLSFLWAEKSSDRERTCAAQLSKTCSHLSLCENGASCTSVPGDGCSR
jgi:hypothetical protein